MRRPLAAWRRPRKRIASSSPRWARGCRGRIVDAGCGPGHWTAYLHDLGLEIEGVDPVERFVKIARAQHPHVTYRQGSFAGLPAGSYGAVLAWYSVIHIPPQDLAGTLTSLRDSLEPQGDLLVGFFAGDRSRNSPTRLRRPTTGRHGPWPRFWSAADSTSWTWSTVRSPAHATTAASAAARFRRPLQRTRDGSEAE